MRQGTTPTHTFTIPFDTGIVAKARVIYAQNNAVKIAKKEPDVKKTGNTISVKLTQEETLRLNHKFNTDIQLRILTNQGDSLVSDIITVSTEQCLSDEVL